MCEGLKDLHRELARKFQCHGPRIEQLWRSLNQEQREKVLRKGSRHGSVLRDPSDTSMGDVSKLTPEWNIRDITAPSSDFLLDMLRHRATTSLQSQYATGRNGSPGDRAHILYMMQNKNLELRNAHEYKDCLTLFHSEERYGQSFTVAAGNWDEVLESMRPAIGAQLIVPQATGDLILKRQVSLLQALNTIIENILDTASTTGTKTKRPEMSLNTATASFTESSFHPTPEKVDLSHLVDSSLDRKSAMEEFIGLISNEPKVLAHEVNSWFSTQPELVADEKGRSLPVHTDKDINGAVFDAVHRTVKNASVWNYISRLMTLLEDVSDKQFRAILLQELSNTCHLEYVRAQAIFKRNVATGSGGSKWFRRLSSTQKDGNPRISLKRSPLLLTNDNPQLHYMLRLCQDETNWSRATDWLQKLEDLHRAHPLEQDKMTGGEFDTLGDLAFIVTFLKSLSSVVKLPVISQKIGQSFVSGFSALHGELSRLKTEVDLGDFAIPINNLLNPGMALGALTTLDSYILEKTGSKLGFLYEDLVDECVSSIHKQHEKQRENIQPELMVPMTLEASESPVQQRRQREKTCPQHSSVYEITPHDVSVDIAKKVTIHTLNGDRVEARQNQAFQLNTTTLHTFSSLFSRSSDVRTSIFWDAFTAAMRVLGFLVVPKAGFHYTFIPPAHMHVQRNITLHRPHRSRIEGISLLVYSHRLNQVYGWNASTFSVLGCH